ncbi:MAG: hypothetical protein R3318_01520 [Gammaproteobacteria bacterium]|nr:hypothetical protein [Gammaproteobacteria bacterium]
MHFKSRSGLFLVAMIAPGILLMPWTRAALAFQPYRFKTDVPQIVVYPNVFLTPARLQNTRLFRLARQIQDQSGETLVEFVKTCLDVMAEVYHEEALDARRKSLENSKDRNKLIRWSRNSLAFANQMDALGKSLDLSSQVELYFETFGQLYILIDGKPVLVSSPVINQQKSLEQRIIDRVCRRMQCDLKLLETPDDEKVRDLWVYAQWDISENNRHVLKTRNGLNFVFADLEDKKLRQHVCLNIARDLNLVADSLLYAKEKGLFIDWGYMYLDVIPGSDKYELVINQFKDAIRLSLTAIPYLNDYPQVAIPWLQARIDFEEYEFNFENAALLVRELSQ